MIHQSYHWVYTQTYICKYIIKKDPCTSMFITALFTLAKMWKQHKCPVTDEWIKNMSYKYTVEYYEYYSAIKRE